MTATPLDDNTLQERGSSGRKDEIATVVALIGLFVFYLITAFVNIAQNDRLHALEQRLERLERQ